MSNQETFTLVIFEIVPEETNLYLIPNSIADNYRKQFQLANNKFINTDDENEGMKFLNYALGNVEDDSTEYAGVLTQYRLGNDTGTPPLENTHITHVYLSGFVL